ncbi:MAG: MFS transporter [Nitrospinota bacterium]|nr:MFS transporter [Nitrospinota bacterium]
MNDRKYIFTANEYSIILYCFLVLSATSFLNFNFGVFIKPLEGEFQWSRTSISAAYSIYMIVGSFGAILTGELSDRYGPQKIILIGMILSGISLCLASKIQNIWEFYLYIGLLAGISRSALNTPIFAYIQKTFDYKRGLATGISGAGGGLGILILTPIVGYLIIHYGWRPSYVVLGSVFFLLSLPALVTVLIYRNGDNTDSAKETIPEENVLDESTKGMKEIMKHRSFWSILGSHSCDCLCHSVIIVHLVPFAIESGVPPLKAATLLGLIGLGALIGRIVAGILSDRIGGKWSLFISLTCQTLPIPLLLLGPNYITLTFIATFVGLGLGGHGTMYPIVTRDYYGKKRVGILFGSFATGASIGMAAGSFLGGIIHDFTGTYHAAFLFSFTFGLCSLFLVWLYPDINNFKPTKKRKNEFSFNS